MVRFRIPLEGAQVSGASFYGVSEATYGRERDHVCAAIWLSENYETQFRARAKILNGSASGADYTEWRRANNSQALRAQRRSGV